MSEVKIISLTKHADFTITCGDSSGILSGSIQFKVHREVLTSRSTVFKETFNLDKDATEIKIRGNVIAVEYFLRACHITGRHNFPKDTKLLEEILELAFRYNVTDLITECETDLLTARTIPTIDAYVLAERYRLPRMSQTSSTQLADTLTVEQMATQNEKLSQCRQASLITLMSKFIQRRDELTADHKKTTEALTADNKNLTQELASAKADVKDMNRQVRVYRDDAKRAENQYSDRDRLFMESVQRLMLETEEVPRYSHSPPPDDRTVLTHLMEIIEHRFHIRTMPLPEPLEPVSAFSMRRSGHRHSNDPETYSATRYWGHDQSHSSSW